MDTDMAHVQRGGNRFEMGRHTELAGFLLLPEEDHIFTNGQEINAARSWL